MKSRIYVLFSLICMALVLSLPCNADTRYKGYINVGGAITTGDTYYYVMGCDGKVGLTLSTEHGVVFNLNNDDTDGLFFGGGIGFDYVNVALDTFNEESIETTNILSNTVTAIPMYLTIKYIYNLSRVSCVLSVRGGYYKWFRGRYISEQAEAKDYKIPYQGSYMLGCGIGVRLPVNKRQGIKYGVTLMLNYDYMGANVKWEDSNIANNKVSLSIGFDF